MYTRWYIRMALVIRLGHVLSLSFERYIITILYIVDTINDYYESNYHLYDMCSGALNLK